MNAPQPQCPGQPLLLLGAGYTATAAARQWIDAGGCAIGTARSDESEHSLQEQGITPVRVDRPHWSWPAHLIEAQAWVLVSLPPEKTARPHQVLQEMLNSLSSLPCQRLLYLSATSVYGDCHGQQVTDDTPVSPNSPRGQRRLVAEQLCWDWGIQRSCDVMVLRLPGIYGPGRSIRKRLCSGRYRLVDEGEMWSNRIHRDDIVSALFTLFAQGKAGETYLASDDQPFQVKELVAWACHTLSLPFPPSIPISEVAPHIRGFWMGSKRCHPQKLLLMGWRPQYSSFREGLRAVWYEEDKT